MSGDADPRAGRRRGSPTVASRNLIDALGLALLGTGDDGSSSYGPTPAVLGNQHFARAFLPGATVHVIDCGAGLWTVLRRSADGSSQVLCAHNVTDLTRTFRPASRFEPCLSEQSPPLFLGGQTSTAGDSAGLICQLAPHTFVWLGHFEDGERAVSRTGTCKEF